MQPSKIADIGDDMLMGNPNHQEEEDEEGTVDGEDAGSENVINREEQKMDNVEALMAGVAIEEKDKVCHACPLRIIN